MQTQVQLIIEAVGSDKEDVPRLLCAFDLVWAKISERVSDSEDVQNELTERVAILIATTGNRRTDADATTLAKIVGRTFDARANREPLDDSERAKPLNPS